jgi:hypothetical protein
MGKARTDKTDASNMLISHAYLFLLKKEEEANKT